MDFDHPVLKRLSSQKAQKALIAALLIIWAISFAAAVNRQVDLDIGSADFREFYNVTRSTVYGDHSGINGLRVAFTYPPFFHVLLAGFSWMPLGVASAFWFLFCSGLAAASVWMIYRLCREKDEELPPVFIAIPLMMGLGLMVNDLIMGNSNLVVCFCIILGLYLFRGRHDIWAGVAIAAGAALKFLPGIFIVYFLYKRRYRVVLGGIIGAVFFFAVVPVISLGQSGGVRLIEGWSKEMLPMLGGANQSNDKWYLKEDVYRGTNQSLLAVLHRMLRPIGAIRKKGPEPKGKVNIADLSPKTVNIIYVILSLAILAGAAFLLRLPTEPDRQFMPLTLEYSIVILVMLLLSRVTWVNYLVHLILPYFAVFHHLRRTPRDSRAHKLTKICLILSFILSIAGASALTQAYAFPLMGALVLGFAVSYDLLYEYNIISKAAVKT